MKKIFLLLLFIFSLSATQCFAMQGGISSGGSSSGTGDNRGGVTVGYGTNADATIITVDRLGTDSVLSWNESGGYFNMNVPLNITGTPAEIKGDSRHLRFTIVNPAVVYGVSSTLCIVPKLSAAITVTNLEVTCNADPTTELAGYIKYADTFIGLANPVIINAIDTTAGVLSTSTITHGTIGSGKCLYISVSTADTATTQACFDITYNY